MAGTTAAATPEVARISLRDNWWIVVPIAALIVAIQIKGDVRWFIVYVHVFTAILWTGTDIFMGFILGPIMRKVDFPVRRAIIVRLMPRMLFYMPTVAAVTTTAGFYMARDLGLFQRPAPQIYWLVAALAITGLMTIQGMGILLPINLKVFFEIRKEHPDGARIQRLMGYYIMVVASQAVMQFLIIFIMVRFSMGYV